MSNSISGITYEVIDSTTAKVTSGSGASGEVNILPRAEISGYAFNKISITSINIPNTVKTLRYNSFTSLSSLKKVVIPESVTSVETWFISSSGPENITFLGKKEPEMASGDKDEYISAQFKGKVNVPLEYEPGKTTFCKKEIQRIKLSVPTKKKRTWCIQSIKLRSSFIGSNFLNVFILCEK